MSIHLMKHNIPTYEKLVEYLKTEESVAVVQATGSGKSYIALNYIENHCSGNIAIVVPTNVLADQWKEKANDLTNANLNIYTYALLAAATDEQLKKIANDSNLFIIDEMHRAGADRWGSAVKTIMAQMSVQNKKTIGLTATPVRGLDNNRNVVDELFDGRLIKGLDLKNAILEGVLPPFEYVAALYDINNQIDTTHKRISQSTRISDTDKKTYDRALGSLKLDNESSKNIKTILNKHLDMQSTQKIILFAKNIEEKDDLQGLIKEWFPNGKLYDIDSTKSRIECQDAINKFNNANSGIHIMSAVNKLNEGIHLKGVTSLIMLRRTESNIIFYQQLGRALDAANKNNNIVVFDLVGNHKEIRMKENIIDFIGFINKRRKPSGKSIIVNDYTKNFLELLDEIEERLNPTWSPEELNILKTYYPIEGLNVYKRLPNRTRPAVTRMLRRLNIFVASDENLTANTTIWTDDELDILREYYPKEGGKVYKRLKNRTHKACVRAAYKQNISYQRAKTVNMIDQNGNTTKFDGLFSAAEYLIKNKYTKSTKPRSVAITIGQHIKKGKIGYGFQWSYDD